MSKEMYLSSLDKKIAKHENLEHYEECAHVLAIKKSILQKDTNSFISLCFDIKTLTKVGFFKKGMTEEEMANRICVFFDLSNVFEYGEIGLGTRIHISNSDGTGEIVTIGE